MDAGDEEKPLDRYSMPLQQHQHAVDFLAELYPAVRQFLYMKGCPLECADEITNDACRIVYLRWSRLRSDSRYHGVAPKAYLFTVARTEWMKRASREHRLRAELIVVDEAELTDPLVVGSDIAGPVVDRVMAGGLVREVLSQMSVPEREVLWLRHAEDFSTRETARILRVAEGTVKHRLHCAVRQFRDRVLALSTVHGVAGSE